MLLVDSDAFIILGATGLLKEAGRTLGVQLEDIRRLDALPFMLDRGRLAKRYPQAMREQVRSWCAMVSPIVEFPREITRQRLVGIEDIDFGEARLVGLLFDNPKSLLLSNDKRALCALRAAADLEDIYERLCGRVVCVETVLLELLRTLGIKVVAEAVSPLRPYNRMLNAVFSMGAETPLDQCLAGLSSYIEYLRVEVGDRLLFGK